MFQVLSFWKNLEMIGFSRKVSVAQPSTPLSKFIFHHVNPSATVGPPMTAPLESGSLVPKRVPEVEGVARTFKFGAAVVCILSPIMNFAPVEGVVALAAVDCAELFPAAS